MNYPLLLGFLIVIVDVVVWRSRHPTHELLRLFIRLALFAALSWVLFSAGFNPFHAAPFANVAEIHWPGQVLEVIWWMKGARLLTLFVEALVLPRSWREQRLFSDVLAAVVYLAAGVAAFGFVLELPVRGLVATSGALAIVLGLAIQSTLSDVFAGIVLNTTAPYSVGDWVVIDDVEGKVVEMNWRATHLLTGQGNTLIVPNAVASKAKILNNSRPDNVHGFSIILEIEPEARPKTVLDALCRALTGCNAILGSPSPHASMKCTTLNSVQYEVVGFVNDMDKKRAATNELFDLCHRHLAAAGVTLRALSVPAPANGARDLKEALIRRTSLFASLTDDDVTWLAQRLSRHEYDANQVIITPGTIPDSLSIVHAGVLSVKFSDASGVREIARPGPGDAFGEIGLLAGLPVSVTVSTLIPTVLYRLGKDEMTSFLQGHPEVATQLVQLLASRKDMFDELNAHMPAEKAHGQSIFQWLFGKVRHLHALRDNA
ncbi:mechanosensitive ion channel family protein [Paraburkholderia sp. DHOC27]|uniref:mechanosensitive ion channel family protein n=1 Tax=Paraburkholderia sp. DHOC27 TaxID=2303330 RepID=UPI000E3E089B|nr:mechanosensitive ion channel family protein [Paraburkholderia sp. DHOC27]RFU48871.1 mechanosensitive ion channel protein MscS [Paraburkholderia sp. DHOC27]